MYLNIIEWAFNSLGTMSDDDYHKKLGEMQKYVPFLETTIKRLQSEKDKPREAQISKLQSLLVILTDSKKKLKLDALKKCEDVILKLYDKVEKKPPVTMMHKYMCRTPPEEKHINENNATFLAARQKLKQTETTPASPSPPLSPQINVAKPVVIPTEKIETPSQLSQNNWDNYPNISQTLNWPVNAFNPVCQNWTIPPKKDIWDRDLIPSNTYKNKKIDREIINYSDTLDSSPSIKIVGNNKEIIPIDVPVKKPVSRKSLPLPPAPQSRKSLEKEILPLNKPPLTDKDLQDLLSPVTESSSGGHSPIFNEDMDLEKLEELKAKLCKELEDEKPKHKKKNKPIPLLVPVPPTPTPQSSEIKNPSPVNPINKKPVKIIERVIKEPDNVFGNLLSSIDEQIMGKKRLEKKPVTKESSAKVMNIKDIASINEKVKTSYLKSEDTKDSNKSTSKPKDKATTKTNEEFKKPDEKPTKELIIPKEIDDTVFKTVEHIMKNLKDSINKPVVPDPLSKFGDLVKEKSDELCPVEMPTSGRLSDKYPHKRKSIESRASDSPSSDTKIEAAPPSQPPKPVQPVKLTDPRLRHAKPNLISPPLKEPPQQQQQQQQQQPRNMEMNRHIDFDQQRNFNKPPNNPEFSFQNSFNNMNNPNFNRGNNIFCNEPPSLPFLSPERCRTPVDPFLNSRGPPPPHEPFHNQGEQFMNAGPPRTPVDPFMNTGPPRTPGDPFMNPGPPRTPGDPFMNPGPPRTPGDPFMNPGPPRTPVDPFMSPGDPFLNQGRPPPPGPPNCNFNQFPNEPMRNQFRNDFPMNHNWNNRPNQFPPNQNQRFPPPPEQNQYDLSQMNPIDFYDNNNPNNNNSNRFEPPPDFNSSFRGRGACNMRGNFVRGRGIPDRGRGGGVVPDRGRGGGGGGGSDRFRDPRQFRNNGPPNNEPPHKEHNRRSRFDDPRDSRDHRGDRDYRRSRFSKEEDHRSSDRPRSSDDRYNRFSSKREEPVRKPGYVREDPRRKSSEESDKPKEKEATVPVPEAAPIIDKPVEKSSVVEVVKEKEEIQSPLDSLYSTETKRVGKGYGLQSFKIPKIKKAEDVKEDTKDIKADEVKELPKKQEEEDPKSKEEIVKPEEKSPEKKEEVTPEAGPSTPTEEPKEPPKTEADLKLDMFNNFMKHIFETCDSSVLFQYLDRCGFSLPNAKTKRIRRIIDSDSSDTEDEHKKEDSETDKPTPEPPAETPEPDEPKTNEPEKIVETVSERIKSRRRKPILSSSDSSPDKSQKKAPTPDKEEDTEKGPRKSRNRVPKQNVKTQAKTRRKNALELLQEDIREMFISEGVLTATGKRMCRMMKEHQESGFIAPATEGEPITEQKDVTESEEEVPLVKRKEKLKTGKQEKSPEVVPMKRPTRKSPRVMLEKIEISKADTTASTDHSEKESESENEMKKPNVSTRRTRRSNIVSGEFLELDENGVVAKVQEKKKKVKPNKSTTDETDALDTSFEDDVSIKSDSHLLAAPKKDETPTETGTEAPTEEESKQDVPTATKKKKIRRRGRGGWATGVIKNKKKKLKSLEKQPDSPALTVSTEKSDLQESGSDEEEPKNKSDTYDEEYSLLKVDINEDVNYYLDNGNKFNCKLCDYKGKLIVHHYRSKHPESENMISRLSPEQASAAKIESKEFNFEEIVPYEEATKGKKRRTTFICRFCLLTFKQEFTCSFFDHICCHTGEYRYKCEKCAFSTGVKKTLSTHCHSLHPDMEKPLTIKPIYEGPPNFRLVFGYLCSACNFTQLLKVNVEKHIRVSHPNQDITIIKISMSTKPIPLIDLKKPEEEQATTETHETEGEPMETTTTTASESPKRKKPKGVTTLESPKTPKKSLKTKPEFEAIEPKEPEVPEVPKVPPPPPPPLKEKEPNLTVFMVPEEISEQEKLIESERLKKMEEIQSNVVPRRSKLQFVDKLKNKLDSVESEIALLESMEAENAALEAETPNLETEEPMEDKLDDPPEIPEPEKNDKPAEEGWISIASTCSLANADKLFDEEPPEEPETQQEMDLEPLNTLDIPLSQNTKKTGFLDTIQRLAAQLQNNKTPSSLSDCEDGEPLYYSPEVTPENSPQRKAQLENTESGDAIKLNAGCIEIQFFGNKNKYACLIPDCYYTSNLKTSFRKHLMDEHKSLRVNCGLCVDENDLMEWDLCGLFLHMLDQHKQETPVKKASIQIKEEPIEPPDISIKSEVFSPEKQPEVLQPGSIRLRRISGDILSSFSSENQIEYPTISIPEAVVSEPDISQLLGQEVPQELPQEVPQDAPINETGFLQISNVRTLTPEEENHLQIKTTSQSPKTYKKIIPKAIILNMGDLASSGVTKIVNNAVNLKRATGKEGITYNFTLNANSEATPTLLTKTIKSDNKPTKTIIFRKTPLDSGVPKLALLSPKTSTNVTLTKGFITTTGAKLKTSMASAKKITFVAPAQVVKQQPTTTTTTVFKTPTSTVFKAPTTEVKPIAPSPDKTKILQPLRLNKSEFTLSIMTEYPKIMDFYKCPCLECIFTTNDRTKFQEHFNTHNRKLPGKYCVYCLSIIAPNDLIDHLERKHGNCNYQCALCFYRACFDMYIAVHQSFCHQVDIPKVYTIPPNVNLSKIAAGLDDGLLPRADAILPYYCTLDGCNRTFYTMNDFRVHMKIYHKRNNVCSICKFELNNSELLIGHYVTHNIANFQCRYCKFGSEKPQILLKHYAVEHYNKNPIVYKREYKSGIMSAHPNDAARLDDIVEINLSYLVKTNRCIPQKPQETQNHIPAATSSFTDEQPMVVTSSCPDEEPPPPPPPLEMEKEASESPEELLIDPTTGELVPAMDKNGLTEPEITLKHRNEESLKAIVDAVDPLNLDDETAEETELYEDSGLNGCELFVCGTSDCSAKLSNLKDFKDHLYSCNVLTNDEGWYTCFHCKKRFKYVGALIKHLTVHGPQKYTCSLCPAKSHQEILILKHLKVQHKIPLGKVVPVDKSAPDTDYVAVAIKPRAKKSKKDDELYEKELQDAIKHTKEQIELIENDVMPTKSPIKQTDDKNSFGPEDIDKLPRPPIFAHEIKCKICSYNTKVRSNMLIHLKAHIENKPVAETAPVNPVPCLEKNELMFDKMTNLAASSHSGGRMGGTKPDKIKDKILVLDYPTFIAASKRYVCGSIGCNYLTHGDSMLRHHLTALHIDEAHYKCPHCHIDLAPDGLNVLAVDNILFHLKMHDLHLYKCNECPFYHYQKHKIEKHLVDEHPTLSKSTFTVIRELDNSANLEDVRPPPPLPKSPEKTVDATEEPQPWRCGFCDYKTATRTAVQGHAANVHKIRSQFKCGSCEFRCSAKNNYQAHYKNKHPMEKVVILSVYYKVTDESSSNLSSSDLDAPTATTTAATTSSSTSFDTTPLWTKNRTGVKHIRGILLDDSPISKRPKIIEKLSENVDEDKAKVKPKSPQKSAETGHNLRFPATLGSPREKFYVCPTCNTFETKNSKQFVIHLYKEINYFRYMCNFCTHKSTHMAEAQKHFKERHSNENVVSNKQICTVLRYYAKAEKWVEKCLQVQQEKIRKYESDLIKQETIDSSTETLLLQLDPETPEKEETTPEKPLLTPEQHQQQQQRRSSRATIKPNLNESFESNDSSKTYELSPPVLEPEIPDLKSPKKSVLKCDHCPFVAKAQANLNKHVRKHFEAKPYKCSLCSYVGSQLAHLQSHFYFKHTSEPLQYTLDPIPEVAQARPLKRKRQASEPTEQPIRTDETIAVVKAEPMEQQACAIQNDLETPSTVKIKAENIEGAQFYVCFHCPRRSPTLDLIREHFLEAHEKMYKNIFKYKKLTIDKPKKTKYSCRFCTWTGHPDGMKQHHMQNHLDKEYAFLKDILFKCEACTEVFNKLGLLKKHFYRAHPNRNVIYQNITKENDDEYIETIEIIEEVLDIKLEKPHEINCQYCVLSFPNFTEMRAHHNLVHNHLEFKLIDEDVAAARDEMKKFKCPQCHHTSNSFPAMRDHLRNHNKPYKCGHCELTASYPNVIKTHHLKEHLNLEPVVLILNEAQKRNEELRDNLLHLINGEYVKIKENLKRPHAETNTDEQPPQKLVLVDEEQKPKAKRRKSIASKLQTDELLKSPIKQKINVAKKSTATPPRIQNVAKKSTTPRPYVNQGFSYYGTRPLLFDEIKNIKTELPIMGKNVSLNIASVSQIFQLFPVVVLDDIGKTNI